MYIRVGKCPTLNCVYCYGSMTYVALKNYRIRMYMVFEQTSGE